MSPRVITPNSWPLGERDGVERFLFYDIVRSGRNVVVIGSSPTEPHLEQYLQVSGGRGWVRPYKFVHEENMFFALSYSITSRDVRIRYKGVERCFTPRPQPPPARVCAMTLFNDGHHLLKPWLDYYTTMGVGHFLLFYNNPVIPGEVQDIVARHEKEHLGSTSLIEWGFPYFLPNSQSHAGAQPAAINRALWSCKDSAFSLLLCDLDEYLVLPGGANILSLLPGLKDSLRFHCRWAKSRSGEVPSNEDEVREYLKTPKLLNESMPEVGEGQCSEEYRSKYIVRPHFSDRLGIHIPVLIRGEAEIADRSQSWFNHYVEFSHPGRASSMFGESLVEYGLVTSTEEK